MVFLYGTLIRNFMHVKENLFGEDQRYTPMNDQVNKINQRDSSQTGVIAPNMFTWA